MPQKFGSKQNQSKWHLVSATKWNCGMSTQEHRAVLTNANLVEDTSRLEFLSQACEVPPQKRMLLQPAREATWSNPSNNPSRENQNASNLEIHHHFAPWPAGPRTKHWTELHIVTPFDEAILLLFTCRWAAYLWNLVKNTLPCDGRAPLERDPSSHRVSVYSTRGSM